MKSFDDYITEVANTNILRLQGLKLAAYGSDRTKIDQIIISLSNMRHAALTRELPGTV